MEVGTTIDILQFAWIFLGVPFWVMFNRISGIKEEFQTYQTKVAEEYVRKTDLENFEKRIFNVLERIETKLDSKADKGN